MKVVNSRGRVLLEVTGIFETQNGETMYRYAGDGMGGIVPLEGLKRTIECVRLDAPSAKIVGELPEAK